MPEIKKVAIIGSGVMGAGIAAQVANAGVEVVMLDIVPKGAPKKLTAAAAKKDPAKAAKINAKRNAISQGALDRLLKVKPAALMHKRNAKRFIIGNTEDNLELIKECDWVVEVVIENLKIKQELYKKLDKIRKPSTIISSNTSTLPLKMLTKGMSKGFCSNFMITHFFNPPRYMKLLEIVSSKATSKASVKSVEKFADIQLGKNVVHCNDTPGFIANRIGTYWILAALSKAVKQDISVEAADAILSRPIGVPRTGVFGLLDLIGVDLMPHVFASFDVALDKDDQFNTLGKAPKIMANLIKKGYTGRKGLGGFYRLDKSGSKPIKEVVDLQTETFSVAKRQTPEAVKAYLQAKKKGQNGLQAMLNHDSPEGIYAWEVLSETFVYAATLVPEITDNIYQLDKAIKLGFNWQLGIFELIDKLGVDWLIEKLRAEGSEIPVLLEMAKGKTFYRIQNGVRQYLDCKGKYQNATRPQGVLLLEDIKLKSKPMLKNRSASLWDIGNGVACLEFHSKMNTFNPLIISMIKKTLKEIPARGFKGLVIYNEAPNFSVGANIALIYGLAKIKMYPIIRWIIRDGQKTFMAMKKAPFPVVGAPSGMALGGGCEVLLHCHAIEAHSESYIGLVEAGVGIVPGWGGCKELLGRALYSKKVGGGAMPAILKTFESIAMAKVATSADECKDLLIFRPEDNIVMNRDRVLASAKARVIKMAKKNYKPVDEFIYNLPGETARVALDIGIKDFVKKGVASQHDALIAKNLANILSGGDTDIINELTEENILKLELDTIMKLLKNKLSLARIIHMVKTGKPLRN